MRRTSAISLFVSILMFIASSAFARAVINPIPHFVLVAGLGGENIPDYFKALKRSLESQGAARVTLIFPSSSNTVSENVPILREKLLRAYRSGLNQPLIVIAHSKGGLEVANVLGRYHEDFPESVVARVVFANVPFRGSPYSAAAISDYRKTWGWFPNSMNPLYLRGLAVLQSLSNESIEANLTDSFSTLTNADLKSVSARIGYFRTEQRPQKVESELRKSAAYLESLGSTSNDGMIPTDNQMLESFMGLKRFGHDMGVLRDTSHMQLFVHDEVTDREQGLRINAFLNQLGPGDQARRAPKSCKNIFKLR